MCRLETVETVAQRCVERERGYLVQHTAEHFSQCARAPAITQGRSGTVSTDGVRVSDSHYITSHRNLSPFVSRCLADFRTQARLFADLSFPLKVVIHRQCLVTLTPFMKH